MFERIKRLFAKKGRKAKHQGPKNIQELYGKNDNPRSAGWKGVSNPPRGTQHPGNVPF